MTQTKDRVQTFKHWEFPKDFKYSIDYDYEAVDKQCECGDNYCRCEEINVTVKPNISDVARTIANNYVGKGKAPKTNEIFEYCIDRILRKDAAYEPDSWNVDIDQGYYGQEIKNITLNDFTKNKIIECSKLSDNEMIEFVLKNEYGFLLPQLEGMSWEIKTVNFEELKTTNKEYTKKVDPSSYEKEIDFPIGVYTYDGIRHRIIDGHHRYVATMNAKKKKVKIICGTKNRKLI